MKLLVDIGNTRLKSALVDGERWQSIDAVTVADIDDALWKNIQKPDSVWIASVASDEITQRVVRHIRERFGTDAHIVRSTAEALGVRNAYAHPERLGVDRFLALVAVHAQRHGAAVIASCGTALTLDALRADGQHLGGLIAPSPLMMQKALRAGAAQLRDVDDAAIVDIAVDTGAAVTSGTWLSAAALTERFVAKVFARLGVAPRLVVTGGGGERLAALLELPCVVETDLVLRGLARLAVG
ncbi:MAG TPA: type III pantothenate kinase [Rudaea sp.]|jgi:type III pantothenate kinase|nr:type III pantothenate kinase [Rudaea sp.]